MKLLIVTEYLRRVPWSASAWAVTIAREMLRAGHEVTVACDGVEDPSALAGARVIVHRPQRTLRGSRPIAFSRWAESSVRRREHGPSLSLTRYAPGTLWAPVDPGARDVVNAAFLQFGPLSAALEVVSRPWLPAAVIAEERALRVGASIGSVRAWLGALECPRRDIALGYSMAIDGADGAPGSGVRDALGLAPGTPMLVASATEARRRGLAPLMGGLRIAAERAGPRAPVLAVLGQRARWVQRVAQENGAASSVRHLGATARVGAVLREADAAVIPWDDRGCSATGRFLCDALGTGRPVLAASWARAVELATPAHFGTPSVGAVVDGSSETAWAEALLDIIEPDRGASASKAARDVARAISGAQLARRLEAAVLAAG